jgi:hypothetical protein
MPCVFYLSDRTDHDQRYCYHRIPTVNRGRLLQFISSWWWAWGCPKQVKRQAINLRDWCIWLVDLFEDIQVWWLTLLRQPQVFCEECNVLDTDPCCILLSTFHLHYLPGCWQVLSPATAEIIDKIHELILEDRRISAKSIAEQLGISRERVGSIIHEDLDMPVACILPGRSKDLSAPLYYSDKYSASYAHQLWAE